MIPHTVYNFVRYANLELVKAALMNYFEEDPLTKVIIYTQWRDMVKIFAKICATERWGHCKYTGEMSHEARSKSIHEFSTNPEKTILIASLLAGGLGLNLTAATKVLLIDPWWNSSVENQAFARYVGTFNSTRTLLTGSQMLPDRSKERDSFGEATGQEYD